MAKLFSIIFPTRLRIKKLRNLLVSIRDTTANLDNVEVRIAYDKDDVLTKQFLSTCNFKFDIIKCECNRSTHFSRDYYNFLARASTGKYIWAINDDVIFETKNWDVIIENKVEEFLKNKSDRICYIGINDGTTKETSGYSCFPMLTRETVAVADKFFLNNVYTWGADIYLWEIFRYLPNRVLNLTSLVGVKHICCHNGSARDEISWEIEKQFLRNPLQPHLINRELTEYRERLNDMFGKESLQNKIFIGIASIHRKLLPTTIKLINNNVSDRNNIEIRVVVRPEKMKKYNKILPQVPVYDGGQSLREAYNKLYEMFLVSECYFFWFLPDDMVSMPPNFDKYILEQHKKIQDDLFVLSSYSTISGRETRIAHSCYIVDRSFGNVYTNAQNNVNNQYITHGNFDMTICYHYSEMFPVFSYKFARFFMPIFRDPLNAGGIDYLAAYFVQQIKRRCGESRNIIALPTGCKCIDQVQTDSTIRSNPYNYACIHRAIDNAVSHIIKGKST